MDDAPMFPAYVQQMGACIPAAPQEPEFDPVAELRQVVEEITGVKFEQPQKPRIGFLP